MATQSSSTFGIGDVFVAVGGGKVQWRLPDGTLNATLDTGLGGYTTGMAFDKEPGNLYVTNFSAGAVTRFDENGNRIGTFGTGYNSAPESILFDAAGDAFVGQAQGSKDVLRFDGDGQLRATYNVPTGPIGSDWIDLSVDQCTLLYTSEGTTIRRFNVCTNSSMTDLTGGFTQAFALRILPGAQGILVADTTTIKLVDNFVGGGVTKIYDAPNQNCWFALNLDPDGTSFWSADFCTSMVYKFDIASGAVLNSFSTGTPSQTVYGLVVNGEFSQARNRDCSSEDISLGQSTSTEPVVVRYDPRYLVDENLATYTTQAQAMADRIQARAVATLAEYRDELGFSIPDHVTIEINCQIRILGVTPTSAPGVTEAENLIKLSADYVRRWMLDPSNNDPNAVWKTLVDHELQHTIQVKARGLILPFLNQLGAWIRYSFGDATNMESSAQLAQDLIAESDDAPDAPASYLEQAKLWLEEPTTIAAGPDDVDSRGQLKYRIPAFLQFVGEHYGSGDTLERKVADYLRGLYSIFTGPDAIGLAAPGDPYVLLRDFYVAARVRLAPNAGEYPDYRILDEITKHGGAPGTPPAYRPLAVRDTQPLSTAQFASQHLTHGQGAVYVVHTLNGASSVRVKVGRSFLNALTQESVRLAFIPTSSDGSVFVNPRNMPDGPTWLDDSWVVPVAGQSELAIVVVAADTDADFDLAVEDAGGVSAIDLIRPTAANPTAPLESACSNTYMPVTVRPRVNGEFDEGLASPAFMATLDGSPVPVTSAWELDDSYLVYLRPPSKPSVGDHTIRVSFNGVTAPQTGQITVVQTTTCSTDREFARTAGLGTLGQGQTGGTTVPVAAGDSSATFALAWSGSDFDLTLTAPSGRTITESTVAPDVHVIQGGSTVEITIDDPEAGSWTVQATGVDVPSPEPVTYTLIETGTAVRSELEVAAQGGAGDPIAVRLSLTDDSLGVPDGAVEATISDPTGVERHFLLFDDGAHADTSPSDGVYGTLVWATDLAGSHHVMVSANAIRADGRTIERQEEADIVLGSKLDTDGDGVADYTEALFGLNPADPGDGSIDFDGDGIGLTTELAQGLDPFSWDTDGGGERDASELAAGRDPRRAGDDRSFPARLFSAVAKDGNLVAISSAASDQTGQIHLYRFSGVARTDLGLRSGTDSTFDDGPLPSGTYRYVAVAVATDGSESAPQFGPKVVVAADVTPPIVRISANDGVWATDSRDARIVFTDLSEPVIEMRLAETETDLASVPWVPYQNPTIFTIGPTAGRHFVLAQVRDAAGNTSAIASAIVDFEPETGPWPSSVRVNDDLGTAQQQRPEVALGPDGAGYVVWEDFRSDSVGDVYFSRRDPVTGIWGSNLRINTDSGSQIQDWPAIDIDAAGNAYAVWHDGRNQGSIYFAFRSASTGAWGANTRIDNTQSHADQRPRIAVGSSGEAIAVWFDPRPMNWNVLAARRPAGWSTWVTTAPLTSGNAADAHPDVVIDAAGTAHAVWEMVEGALDMGIWYANLSPGNSSWSSPVKISDEPSGDNGRFPRVGIDDGGELVVSWMAWDGSTPQTRVSRRQAGSTTWSPSELVSGSSMVTGSDSLPSLDVRPDGAAFVVWPGVASDGQRLVWASEYDPIASSWSTPTVVSDDSPPAFSIHPSVAFGDGVTVAWTGGAAFPGGDIRSRQR